ncbi:hypothetical protein BT96DRAFT_914248, partial [Gymnopus androsaceus JB14]
TLLRPCASSPTVFSLLAVATTAVVAQSASIGAPADMAEIELQNSHTSVTEVALVIGLFSCATTVGTCLVPSEALGTILYDGPPGTTNLPPHQNFTLTVPESFATGPAQFGVAYFSLLGASEVPFFETLNTTIVIT